MSSDMESAAFEAARVRMVDRQVRPSDVTRPELIDAMLWAPRERFLPKSKRPLAYMGEHVDLGGGRVELDPRTLAKMIEELGPRPDDLALVIGSGGGYAAAVMSRLCAAVVALEEDPALSTAASESFAAIGVDTVINVSGPLAAGWAENGPYNVILVNGAVEAGALRPGGALAKVIDQQLASGGRLAALNVEGALGWCAVAMKAASHGPAGLDWSARRAFDAAAPILPGFAAEKEFVF